MAEKSEKATPKKLREGRKKGQVAKSKDFPAAFTFVVSFALVVTTSTYLFQSLSEFMITSFRGIEAGSQILAHIPSLLVTSFMVIFNTSAPFMFMISLVGVLVNFLIIGPLFSVQAMKPDLKKLNPVTNLKNMFKVKTFVELAKSIFKITGALVIIYGVVQNSLPQIIATAAMPIIGCAVVFSEFLIKVALRVGIFFLAIAIFDLIFQKRAFAKEMKMEKFDVKQESKDTEGNPEIKGKRRQVQQEIAYQDGPQATRRARAVITNPIHLAIALEYEAERDPAPRICVMGKGVEADIMIKIAVREEIPVMRNPPLAQELYNKGQIGHYVPEETYEAIAEVLKWLDQLEETLEHNVEIFKQ